MVRKASGRIEKLTVMFDGNGGCRLGLNAVMCVIAGKDQAYDKFGIF